MEYVSSASDVKVGDQVVTSGIDGIYPKGFVIGQIESIERGAGIFSAIIVRPAVDFASIEDVLVVLTPPEPGAGSDEPEPGTRPSVNSGRPEPVEGRKPEPGT
jgi:rod shape-determining protein MreC